jgi:hypothetical protein
MIDPASICFLSLFPLVIFIIGAYFFYRAKGFLSMADELSEALKRGPLQGALSVLSGKPSSEVPVASHLGKPGCIYSKLILEYLDLGRGRWVPLKTFERRAAFELSGFSVDPAGAEYDAAHNEIFQESKKLPPKKDGVMGEIGQFGAQMRSAKSSVPLSAESAEPYGTAFDAKPFDSRTMEALANDYDVGEVLRQYWHQRKRATIQTILLSDDVVVVGTAGRGSISKGTGRFLISVEALPTILKQSRGKAWVSIIIGSGLILLSLAAAALLFS